MVPRVLALNSKLHKEGRRMGQKGKSSHSHLSSLLFEQCFRSKIQLYPFLSTDQNESHGFTRQTGLQAILHPARCASMRKKTKILSWEKVKNGCVWPSLLLWSVCVHSAGSECVDGTEAHVWSLSQSSPNPLLWRQESLTKPGDHQLS